MNRNSNNATNGFIVASFQTNCEKTRNLLRSYAVPPGGPRAQQNAHAQGKGVGQSPLLEALRGCQNEVLRLLLAPAVTTLQITRRVRTNMCAACSCEQMAILGPAARSSSPGSVSSFHTANPIDSERSSPRVHTDVEGWQTPQPEYLSSLEVAPH